MRFKICILFLVIVLVYSCARQGSPSGGPKDETPPKYLSSEPDTLSLNVSTDLKEIKLNFDEYLVLKDYQNNVVVSPSLGNSAQFLPVGSPAKTVRIKLSEPLKENTTYNINFGDAIQDNNEGNILRGYQFVFSTGDYLDSLKISGLISAPSERKQSKNLVVGLYPFDENYNDSLILREKPFYVAKPNESGYFKMNYLRPGKYQLIAFDDEVQNMHFDPGKEKIGFINQPVELNSNQKIDVELFSQKKSYKAVKAEQKEYGQLVFKFEGEPDEVKVEPIDFEFSTSSVSYIPKSDSLNFWFNPAVDSIGGKSKRLKFLVNHKNSNDTISVVYSNSIPHKIKIAATSKLETSPGRNLKLSANYPIKKLDSSFVNIQKDSLVLKTRLISDPENENNFSFDFPVELSSKYKVELLPGALTDIFGETNDTLRFNFNTKTRNDYGHLKLILNHPPKHPYFLKFFNESGNLLDEQYGNETEFEYNYLTPGNYYFQIQVDENENRFWDTGDFFERKKPEPTLIYPGVINVRAMWNTEETWVLPYGEPGDVLVNDPADQDVKTDL